MDRSEKFYTAVPVQDDLGTGFRLFSHTDDVYTARIADGIDSRLYGNDGDWQAKIRVLTTDDVDAFEEYDQLAEQMQDEYGIDPSIAAHEFNRQLEDDEEQPGWEDRQRYFGYNTDGDIVPGGDTAFEQGMLGAAGTYIVGGAATGGTVGASFGPEGILLGGLIGGFSGFIGVIGDAMVAAATDTVYKPISGVAAAGSLNEKRHTRKYKKGKYFPPQEPVEDLNRLNHLDRVIEETNRLDGKEEFNDLQSNEVDETFEEKMALIFDDVRELSGLHAGGTFESYDDAVGFIALVQGVEADIQRPSIYQEPAVFRELFSNFVYERDGEEHILTEGEELIDNVFGQDADPAIDEFLQTEYPELYDDVGMGGLP